MRAIVLIALMLSSSCLLAEIAGDLASSLPKPIQEDWPKRFGSAKVTKVSHNTDGWSIEASDALNPKFSVEYSEQNALVSFGPRTVKTVAVPEELNKLLQRIKIPMDETCIAERKKTDEVAVYVLTGKREAGPVRLTAREDGLLIGYERILTDEQKKRESEEAAKTPPATVFKITIGKDGYLLDDGKDPMTLEKLAGTIRERIKEGYAALELHFILHEAEEDENSIATVLKGLAASGVKVTSVKGFPSKEQDKK